MKSFSDATMPNTEFDVDSTIAIFSFPLPSPTNYSLLANLVTILSHVYPRVIIFTGNFTRHLRFIIDDLRLSNKKHIYVYDFKHKLFSRDSQTSLLTKFFVYIKIQVSFIVAVLKLHSTFGMALFFIGIPHMLPLLVILRLLGKKIILY
jgi:hypothetical protein